MLISNAGSKNHISWWKLVYSPWDNFKPYVCEWVVSYVSESMMDYYPDFTRRLVFPTSQIMVEFPYPYLNNRFVGQVIILISSFETQLSQETKLEKLQKRVVNTINMPRIFNTAEKKLRTRSLSFRRTLKVRFCIGDVSTFLPGLIILMMTHVWSIWMCI